MSAFGQDIWWVNADDLSHALKVLYAASASPSFKANLTSSSGLTALSTLYFSE